MTGSIAANCTLIEANGDDWLLHLDPAHSALFNPTQQRRLNDALNQQQGRSIKLRIELCKPEQETPAQAAARRRDQQLAQGALPLLGITVQPDSKPIGDLAARWQTIARPAAVIEAIRRQSAKTPPRILILQQQSFFFYVLYVAFLTLKYPC